MQLLIWLVNSNVENSFSTAVVGFVSGPLFPGTLRMANDVLPQDVHMISMAIMWAHLLSSCLL
jgi:fucose permease